MLKVLDLFSGIGGFTLGLDSTGGFETIAFVEKDKFCQKVLKKNFPNITIEGEIRDVKGDRYKADVITGGFPCQPFSVAGKRKGTDDDRYLWDETIRVIRECKPKWFIGENVEGLVNIQEGMVLRQVQTDLEKEGFEVQCLIIPASGIGAWHQRKRVWIIGCNVSNSDNNGSHRQKRDATIKSSNEPKEWLFIRDDKNVSDSKIIRTGESRNINQEEGFESSSSTQSDSSSKTITNSECLGWKERTKKSEESYRETTSNKFNNCNKGFSIKKSCSPMDVQDSNGKGSQGHKFQQHLETGEQSTINNGKRSSERQQTWWQTQSKLCGVPNGISYELDKDRANRVKALGNSIVPQIARELGLAILDAEQN